MVNFDLKNIYRYIRGCIPQESVDGRGVPKELSITGQIDIATVVAFGNFGGKCL